MPASRRHASATARCARSSSIIPAAGPTGKRYKVEKLAWQAMTAVKDTECQEKMGIVEHYAAALYSEAEHHKWRIASLPGSDFLRLQILRALVAFKCRLLAIEAARRNGIDPNQPPLRRARARSPKARISS